MLITRKYAMTYSDRVEQLEAEGLTTSDAQGVADTEVLQGTIFDFDPQYPLNPSERQANDLQ